MGWHEKQQNLYWQQPLCDSAPWNECINNALKCGPDTENYQRNSNCNNYEKWIIENPILRIITKKYCQWRIR